MIWGKGDLKTYAYEMAKEPSRQLRKQQTNAEWLLWQRLRNGKFFGKTFFRQQPILFELTDRKVFFIADFCCRENLLAIEIDGKSHEYQKEYDEYRTYIINSLGIRVVRFKNQEIEGKMDEVLLKLRRLVEV